MSTIKTVKIPNASMDVEETDDLYIVDRNLNGKFTLENINELS